MNQPKTKIAIISHALGGGGAERFGGLLSFILTDLGYDVHNIILNEPQDYDYSGSLLNLGKMYRNVPEWKRKFLKMMALRSYLKDHNINTIIDNRPRSLLFREWVTKQVFGNRKMYFLIQNYNLKNYLPKSVFLAKWFYGNAEKFICVSKAIEAKVRDLYHFKNTVTIYNPTNLVPKDIPDATGIPENYILFFGRFDEKAKNFTLMLEAFSVSAIYKKGYTLILMGEGPDEHSIRSEVGKRNLDDYVKIIAYQKNPFSIVKKAKYTILTSRFEGFPLSIGESLAVGTPVISVDCKSGPSEVITNKENGLLIENHNPEAFAKAMNLLIDNKELYQHCKNNASKSVAHLSLEAVSKRWQQILSQ